MGRVSEMERGRTRDVIVVTGVREKVVVNRGECCCQAGLTRCNSL